MTALLVVFLGFLVAASALCSGLEMGFLSLPPNRIRALARQGSAKALAVAKKIADMPRVVNTLLVANNIVNISLSTVSTAMAAELFSGSVAAELAWSSTVAVTVLFLGEYLPKLVFSACPTQLIFRNLWFYRILEFSLKPLVAVFSLFTRMVFGGAKSGTPRPGVSRDGLRTLLADADNGTMLTSFERRLIDRVLMLQTLTAGGMVHAFDPSGKRPTLRIEASTRGDDILPLMRRAHRAEATVFDGGSGRELGVVTEEDVLVALTGVLKE